MGIVVVPTAERNLRISVDLTIMNKYICFELHMLLCVEHMLGQLKDAKIFAKLDAQSGFWQILLSMLLTTFITPFGCYCFKRFPFGTRDCPKISQLLKCPSSWKDWRASSVKWTTSSCLQQHRNNTTHDSVLERLQQAEFSKKQVKVL